MPGVDDRDVAPKSDQLPRLHPEGSNKAVGAGDCDASTSKQQQHLKGAAQTACASSSYSAHLPRQLEHAAAPAGDVAITVSPSVGAADTDVVRLVATSDQHQTSQPPAAAAAAVARNTSSSEHDFVVIELQPAAADDWTQPGRTAELTAPAAAAALPHSSSTASLRARLQVLRAASLARCSVGAASAAGSSVADSQIGQRECRICLQADFQEDIVTPCSCSGSVQYAHLECLKAWVAERCSLQCELCGKQYRPELQQQLEAMIDPRKLRARQRRAAAAAANGHGVGGADMAQQFGEGDEDGEPPQQISWTRFWVHLGILVMLLVAVLYLSLFVNVGASDNFWLMFLWRAITVILPLFLIIRCVAALYTWRQQYLAQAAARER